MTISGYSSAIVDAMLGWLKGFANWVLRLFHLAGGVGTSPLLWLAHNWLLLLIVLMAVGVAADILVWLVRWRPHWVWFRKERVIVNDENFFNDSDIRDRLDLVPDDLLEKNWQERDYVVASTLVRPQDGTRPSVDAPKAVNKRGGRDGATVVRRGGDADGKGSFRRGERRRKGSAAGSEARQRRMKEAEEKARRIRSEREADLFGLDGNQPDVTDFYEDEVFNVNNLPRVNDFPFEDVDDTEEE